MQGAFGRNGPVTKEEARLKCLAALPRPTVADLEKSDKRIADGLSAVTAAALSLGVPALCAAVYQAVAL